MDMMTFTANLYTRGAGEVCRGFDLAGLVLTSLELLSLSSSLSLSLSLVPQCSGECVVQDTISRINVGLGLHEHPLSHQIPILYEPTFNL